MRESARYAWWLLIVLFALIIFLNMAVFLNLYLRGSTTNLREANAGMLINFSARYAVVVNRYLPSLASTTLSGLEDQKSWESVLTQAVINSYLGTEGISGALDQLDSLPSETLSPTQRRWYSAVWRSVLTEPISAEQVSERLRLLQSSVPEPVLQLAEIVLWRKAGDTERSRQVENAMLRAGVVRVTMLLTVFTFAGLAFLLGLLFLIALPFLLRFGIKFWKAPERPLENASPFALDPLLWGLVIFMLLIVNIGFLVRELERFGIPDASVIGYLVAVVVPLWFLVAVQKQEGEWSQVRWFQGRFWRDVGASILGYSAYLPFLLGAIVITTLVASALPAEQTNPIGERVSEGASLGYWLWTFVQAAVLAPIVEEFLFRGVLFGVLWQRTGNLWLSAFVSGYLFAVIHPQFLGGIIALTIFGMIMAFTYAYTRSLLPCILMHAYNNGALTLLLWSYS